MASILYVPIIFFFATCWLFLLVHMSPKLSDDERGVITFPSSLDDLKALAKVLALYFRSHQIYVVILFASAYIYKQAFAIPGSVFLNVLAGSLFGLYFGFPLICVLSAFGSSCCYILAKYFGKPYVSYYFPDQVLYYQTKVEENKDEILYYLIGIRMFPVSPNWLINVICAVINVPLYVFSLSVFIGLMPYNFICSQTGLILSQITSLSDVFTFTVMLKLGLIASISLIPSIYIKLCKKKKSDKEKQAEKAV